MSNELFSLYLLFNTKIPITEKCSQLKAHSSKLNYKPIQKNETMRDFSKLFIWQKSHKLVMSIYDITNRFPKSEMFGLTSQIRRASASIPINISEGCGRGSNKDFARFLQIAIGSACEVEYELLLAKELKYIEDQEYQNLSKEIVSIRKMIIKYQSELN
jgi:four helix bundle protein